MSRTPLSRPGRRLFVRVTLIRLASALALALLLVAADRTSRADAAEEHARVMAVGTGSLASDARDLATVVRDDTLQGKSGKLRVRFVPAPDAENFPYLRQLFRGKSARAGVYEVEASAKPFAFITMLPFSQKIAGRIGSYRIGFWPGERGSARGGKYDNPRGFIQVTPDNQHTAISDHFRLRDFLTHDQQSVWPKYLVLHEDLIDKLELVLADLQSRGYDAKTLHVMSGFRTPQYNESGGETAGRATLSRHQYGDAADVWVENGAGRMADLNRDGRVDARDAAVVAQAAERVERSHPELVGGVGIYRSTRAHGPFVHIDTRGSRARWGSA